MGVRGSLREYLRRFVEGLDDALAESLPLLLFGLLLIRTLVPSDALFWEGVDCTS